jgi:hypothetical protein
MKTTHWRRLNDKGYRIAENIRNQQLHYSEKDAKSQAELVRQNHRYFAQAVHVVSPGINYWVVMYKRRKS